MQRCTLLSLYSLSVGLYTLSGCGTGASDSGTPSEQVSSGESVPAGGNSIPDSLCDDPVSVLPPSWLPIDQVSGAEFAAIDAGTFTVDASAGGFGNASAEPFVYVRMTDVAEKVSLSDTAAFGDANWDLAFKRHVVRTNGGDSGAGQIRVARTAAPSLDALEADDIASEGQVDIWASEACELITDAIGAPETALSGWYQIDTSNQQLTALEEVYVLTRPNGDKLAFEILSYYNAQQQSAHYTIAWKTL